MPYDEEDESRILFEMQCAMEDSARAEAEAERCVVGPDEVVVKREEWAALGQIVTLVNKHINDPCYLRNQLVPIVDKASALRSGEAGKGAIYCGEHTAAEIPAILAAHPGYTLPSSHDF